MKWEPIETAPKDGTAIVVASNGWIRAVVRWMDIDSADSEWGTVEHTPDWQWAIEDGKNDRMYYRGWNQLTHWMPLPPPPVKET